MFIIITLIKTFLKRADHRTLSRLLQMFRYLLCARPSATAMALPGIYTDHDNRPISQIPQCIHSISHNAPFCNRNVHMCAHFCYKMMHRGIFAGCIVGFVKWVYSCCSHKHIVLLMVMIMPLITAQLQRTDYLTSSRKLQMLQILFIIYMSDIHTVSNNLNFILYADDTTLTSPLCSFTYGGYQYIKCVSTLIN